MKAALLALALSCGAGALEAQDEIRQAEAVLRPLIEAYGPSGAEGPVRELVTTMLPAWAEPTTDSAGNLWVTLGSADPVVVLVAHLDEIGFRVTGIGSDGVLTLARLGGFFPSLYAHRPALIHTGGAPVPGVFLPDSAGVIRLDTGLGSAESVREAGVEVGQTATMPKSYQRLAGTRVTGRSLDDRVGTAALVLALGRLDPARVRQRVVFLFSVREEVGLDGARVAADALGTRAVRVYPVDTFVSADGPLELPGYARAPLGEGAVIRAVDNSNVAPAVLVDSLLALARRHGIPLQLGATGGGNDGSAFAPWGVADVPIAWPLRYSHSPVEVADLRDVAALARLVQAIAED